MSPAAEVSFVIPCLNEEASIALVVGQARDALVQLGVPGEVVVVDNGSEDRSAELARAAGARVYMSEEEPMLEALWRRFRLEHGLVAAAITLLAGVLITLVANFDGVPDPALGLLGLTLVALGVQGIFGAFFLSILGLPQHAILRRGASPETSAPRSSTR